MTDGEDQTLGVTGFSLHCLVNSNTFLTDSNNQLNCDHEVRSQEEPNSGNLPNSGNHGSELRRGIERSTVSRLQLIQLGGEILRSSGTTDKQESSTGGSIKTVHAGKGGFYVGILLCGGSA